MGTPNWDGERVVAIHQPNFFPWLGYFSKIFRSDTFVLLDDVQLPNSGGSWVNRVKLRVGGQARWVTAPLDRSFAGVRAINEVELLSDDPWRSRFLRTIRLNYARAPHFAPVFSMMEGVLATPESNLARFNELAIRSILEHLGEPRSLARASTLATRERSTRRLIALVGEVGGTAYLSGGGASGYQQDELFETAGVGLVYQEFKHPIYSQTGPGEFVAGLSTLDCLFELGFQETAKLLRALG